MERHTIEFVYLYDLMSAADLHESLQDEIFICIAHNYGAGEGGDFPVRTLTGALLGEIIEIGIESGDIEPEDADEKKALAYFQRLMPQLMEKKIFINIEEPGAHEKPHESIL